MYLKKVYISPLFFKEFFWGQFEDEDDSWFFFFYHFEDIAPLSSVFLFAQEQSAASLVGLSLAPLKLFSLSLVFCSFILMWLDVHFFLFVLIDIHCASCICGFTL